MKIAVLPGDGIGPEIMAQAVKVMKALEADGLKFELEEAPVGGAGYDAAGDPLPAPTLDLCRQADAVLFGAVGGPQYDSLPRAKRPEQGLLGLRKELGLFANLRPAVLYPELAAASALKPEVVAGLDIMILRELTGDIYFGQPRGRRQTGGGEREGFDTMKYDESEIRRIARVGFEIALKRNRKLCSVDKANVLDTSILWREVVSEVAQGLPAGGAYAHVRGQCRHAAGARTQAVRRHRHRQHVRRHSVGRGVHADGFDRHAALGFAGRDTARACTSRSTARHRTSPARTSPIRWPLFFPWR